MTFARSKWPYHALYALPLMLMLAGDARAQSRLGWMYYEGKGIGKDFVLAYMWSNLAAAQLSGEERTRVEKVRDFIASKLTPDELKLAQQRARDWKPKTE